MTICDLAGQVFGRLTVLSMTGERRNRSVEWLCKCECGNLTRIASHHLKDGAIKSCGCLLRDKHFVHGHNTQCHTTRTHKSWTSMIERCTNPKSRIFPDYGGRGITVCERWRSFPNFLDDMGERPDGTALDRRDNSRGYSPDNCRWATPIEQANNKRNNIFIEHLGRTMTASQWSRETGLKVATITWRYRNGWPPESILNRAFPGGHGAR